jgi:ELWxxDGT repeat protein
VLFNAYDPAHGYALWRSDGTEAGTTIVEDVGPDPHVAASGLVAGGGTLFFSTADEAHGYELWRSDGTPAGTELVEDITPGRRSSFPDLLAHIGGTLFFTTASGRLWTSDGTAAGTRPVKRVGSAGNPLIRDATRVGDGIFFQATDDAHGSELWKSDGTAAGTVLVKDINTTAGGAFPYYSSPSRLTNVAGALFFAADDGTHGQELWSSDGTAPGTQLVRDVNPGDASSFPQSLANVGGTLFLQASNPSRGAELWKAGP